MNIVSFRQHIASRKPVPIQLRTKKKVFKMPKMYTDSDDSNNEEFFRLDPGRVTHIDLTKSVQVIILDLKEPATFNKWLKDKFNVDRDHFDVRLSRFQRAFGGMPQPAIRKWKHSEKGGLVPYEQVDWKIQPGDTVTCALKVRVVKERVYFDLHRDIIIEERVKTKDYPYFSDCE